MKVLVTGGSGFLGQHLVEYLLEKDYDVTVYDIQKGDWKGDFNWISGDVFNFPRISDAVQGHDAVIHLVGLPDLRDAQKHPTRSFRLNLITLQNVLEASRVEGARIIFPSSAAVYGIPEDLPIAEDHPLDPPNVYGSHKILCEKLIRTYQKNYGLDYTIFRPFNIYGAGSEGVIGIFLNRAFEGKPIQMFGADQRRDFVYARDVAEAFTSALECEESLNETINIGSGEGKKIEEIGDIILQIFPEAEIEAAESEMEEYDSIADISKTEEILGFDPHSADEFMRKVIEEEMLEKIKER